MSIAIDLTQDIGAELDLGKIRLSGIKELPTDSRKKVYESYVHSLPEIKTRFIAVAQSKIKSLGGVIHPDNNGLNFPKSVELDAAKEAWAIFLDIRPLLTRETPLFSIGYKKVRARLYDGKINIIWPNDLTSEERELGEQTLKNYPPSKSDFE